MTPVDSSRLLLIGLCCACSLACPGGEHDAAPAPARAWPAGDLVAVEVVDNAHLIVLGATGEIHVSDDGGDSWRAARGPSNLALRSLSMADDQFGWAIGSQTILKTEDGGATWRRQGLAEPTGSVPLAAISAIDRERAVAVGKQGRRIVTQDGGRLWRSLSRDPALAPGPLGAVADVACRRGGSGRCWSVGSSLDLSQDAGRSWRPVEIADFAPVPPLTFDATQVEATRTEIRRLAEFVASNRHRSAPQWRLDPRISPGELEQVGRRRDPDALFELMAARIQEMRSRLEEAGVAPDRVIAVGTPPWDYADYLDEDPEFLERYWLERAAPQSAVHVRMIDTSSMRALCVGVGCRGGDGTPRANADLGLAVGEMGAMLRSDDAGNTWQAAEHVSRMDLLDVGIGLHRAIAVGVQGGMWLSQDRGRSWGPPDAGSRPAFFDALRAVSFSPSGEVGMIVGEHGRILRSIDGGVEWSLLVAPDES